MFCLIGSGFGGLHFHRPEAPSCLAWDQRTEGGEGEDQKLFEWHANLHRGGTGKPLLRCIPQTKHFSVNRYGKMLPSIVGVPNPFALLPKANEAGNLSSNCHGLTTHTLYFTKGLEWHMLIIATILPHLGNMPSDISICSSWMTECPSIFVS